MVERYEAITSPVSGVSFFWVDDDGNHVVKIVEYCYTRWL